MKKTIKILILDDSEKDVKKINGVLVDSGFEYPIISCGDGTSYLSYLNHLNPDVVLAEHTIPNYNSFKAFSDAKEKYPNIIFILVSDEVPEEFAVELLKEGIDDYE